MTRNAVQANYRIACAREALEVGLQKLEEAQQWLAIIDESHQADMQYDIKLLQEIMQAVFLLDSRLQK